MNIAGEVLSCIFFLLNARNTCPTHRFLKKKNLFFLILWVHHVEFNSSLSHKFALSDNKSCHSKLKYKLHILEILSLLYDSTIII